MALPVTISSPDFSPGNYYAGPFKAPNQAIYVVLKGINVEVWKATDPTDSFAEQDTGGKSIINRNPTSIWAYLSGSELHIASASGGNVEYFIFDTADDTYTLIDEEVDPVKDAPTNPGASISVRSDGDVIVLYSGDQDSDMGNPFERVDYARKEGSNWVVGVDVGGVTPADEDRVGGVLVRGSADNMHFLWNHPAETNELRGTTLDSGNGLGTTQTLDLMTTPAAHAWAPGIAWNDGGTWRVVVPVEDADTGELVVVRWVESSGDLAASPGTTVVGSPEDVLMANATPIACAAVDGDGRMYLMWGEIGRAHV